MNSSPSQSPSCAKKRWRCVAFDFDGTLANTTPAIVATAHETLLQLELAPLCGEDIRPWIGLPLVEAFMKLGLNRDIAAHCGARYRELFDGHSDSITLFPGVLESLEFLREKGLTLGIVSSRGRHSLKALVARLLLTDHFTAVLGAEDAALGKPSPALLHNLAETLDIPPQYMLVVGDTTFDIEMGRAAGAQTCGVTYGNHNAARLRAAGPNYVIDSLPQLEALL